MDYLYFWIDPFFGMLSMEVEVAGATCVGLRSGKTSGKRSKQTGDGGPRLDSEQPL